MKKSNIKQVVIGLLLGGLVGVSIAQIAIFLNIRFSIKNYILVLVGFFAILCLNVIIHELGHLVMGSLTGYRFLSFRIFDYSLHKKDGSYKLVREQIPGTLGQCLMAFSEDHTLENYPYKLYNLGGIIFNLGGGILSLGLAFLLKDPVVRMALYLNFLAGTITGLLNLIPFKSGANDGSNLKNISNDPNSKRAFFNVMKIEELIEKDVDLKDIPDDLVDLSAYTSADSPLIINNVYAKMLKAFDGGKFEEGFALFENYRYSKGNIDLLDNMMKLQVGLVALALDLPDRYAPIIADKTFQKFLMVKNLNSKAFNYLCEKKLGLNEKKIMEANDAYIKAFRRAPQNSERRYIDKIVNM